MLKKIIIPLLFAIMPMSIMAQDTKHLLGIGRTEILDTYLSQEHYSGTELRYIFTTSKDLKRNPLWNRTATLQIDGSITSPRSDVATCYGGMLTFSYGMHRKVVDSEKFCLSLGAQGRVFAGGLYNDRNGNNPAQLKTGIDLSPSVIATYRFHALSKQMRLSYRISAPVVGMQFSPAYGQSYYELFGKGDYDGNLCFAHIGNAPSLTNMLTLDIPLKKRKLTIGYLGDFRQSHLHSLKYHTYTHSLLIGITL